jgi:hypothetical protein
MKVKDITTNALLIALIVVMAIVPQLGFISLFGVALTLIHIPVLIGALLFPKYGWVYGLTFGLTSLFVALTRPVTPIDLLFQNPLVSVAPRLAFGALIPVVYTLSKRLTSSRNLQFGLTAASMTLVHGVFVLSMIAVFGVELLGGSQVALQVIGGVLLSNSVPEALVAVMVVVPIVRRLYAIIY